MCIEIQLRDPLNEYSDDYRLEIGGKMKNIKSRRPGSSCGRRSLQLVVERRAGQPPAGLHRIGEPGGVFARGDPEHPQQQRLVGALRRAGRGQDDAVGLALDAVGFTARNTCSKELTDDLYLR